MQESSADSILTLEGMGVHLMTGQKNRKRPRNQRSQSRVQMEAAAQAALKQIITIAQAVLEQIIIATQVVLEQIIIVA